MTEREQDQFVQRFRGLPSENRDTLLEKLMRADEERTGEEQQTPLPQGRDEVPPQV